jgi:hypothetical protein
MTLNSIRGSSHISFTAHDPFEDTETGSRPDGQDRGSGFTAHDPFEDTERA